MPELRPTFLARPPGCKFFGDGYPGWSSLSLLDPGLISVIPLGIKILEFIPADRLIPAPSFFPTAPAAEEFLIEELVWFFPVFPVVRCIPLYLH